MAATMPLEQTRAPPMSGPLQVTRRVSMLFLHHGHMEEWVTRWGPAHGYIQSPRGGASDTTSLGTGVPPCTAVGSSDYIPPGSTMGVTALKGNVAY